MNSLKINITQQFVNTPCVYIRANDKFDGPLFRWAYIKDGLYSEGKKLHFGIC